MLIRLWLMVADCFRCGTSIELSGPGGGLGTGSREWLSLWLGALVEGHSHHTVSRVKGFLDAIAVVDVNVQVEHAGMVPGHSTQVARCC